MVSASSDELGTDGRLLLIVEDEPAIADLLALTCTHAGFRVVVARDGEAALERVADDRPALVLLDIGLPGLDGIEVCRRIRTFSDCYVIVVTARAEEVDTLIGLSVGADDYLTKPFSMRELTARVQTVLRRPRTGTALDRAGDDRGPLEEPVREFGELRVDAAGRQVHLAGQPVALTPTERDLLLTLARRPAMAFSRRQLIDQVWGSGWVGDEHLVDVHVAHLRRKLGDTPDQARFVVTVRGVGYRMGPG